MSYLSTSHNAPSLRMLYTAAFGCMLTLSACGSSSREVVKGGLIGAGGGALVGAVVPGVSAVEGAAVGAAGGAIYGAVKGKDDDKKIYTDSNGNKYWIDSKGRRVYL